MDIVIPLLLLTIAGALPIVAVYGSLRLARRATGGWRIAALLPVIALGLTVANIAVGVAIDATSHNLWPFELVMVSAGGVAWLGVLVLLGRWNLGPGAPSVTAAPLRPAGLGGPASPGGASPAAAPDRAPPRPGSRGTPSAARTGAGLEAMFAHPVVRAAAGVAGVYFLLYGYASLRAGGGRGAAALMVFGVAGLFLAATGRAPGWLRR